LVDARGIPLAKQQARRRIKGAVAGEYSVEGIVAGCSAG